MHKIPELPHKKKTVVPTLMRNIKATHLIFSHFKLFFLFLPFSNLYFKGHMVTWNLVL